MKTTYKGDSPGKKVQRLRAWMHMICLSQILEAPYRGALVLAGAGGDVDVLKGLGFPAHTITAVDFDRECLLACRDKGAAVKLGDVGDVVRGVEYSMAHIDFCGTFSAENLRTLSKVVRGFGEAPGILAVTLLKGRERKGTEALMAHIPRTRRRELHKHAKKGRGDSPDWWSRMSIRLTSGENFNPRELLREAHAWCQERDQFIGYADKAFVRQAALETALFNLCLAEREPHSSFRIIEPAGVMDYHSRSEDAYGTPFMTAFFIVYPRRMADAVKARTAAYSVALNMRDSMPISECMTVLKPTAVSIAELVGRENAATIFDVKPSTISAWKAHQSRGTYEASSVFGVDAIIEGIPRTSGRTTTLNLDFSVRLGETLGVPGPIVEKDDSLRASGGRDRVIG